MERTNFEKEIAALGIRYTREIEDIEDEFIAPIFDDIPLFKHPSLGYVVRYDEFSGTGSTPGDAVMDLIENLRDKALGIVKTGEDEGAY